MTRDEALLWLNDRIGKTVHVSVVLQRDYDVHVLEGDGPLQHWTEGPDARPEHLTIHAEDLTGWYRAGATSFDLTDLGDSEISQPRDADEIEIELGGDVVLPVIEVGDSEST